MTTSPTAAPSITLASAVEMPMLGLGVFQSPPDETIAAVDAAVTSGYRLIDTAAAYGNEREVGEGIRELSAHTPRSVRGSRRAHPLRASEVDRRTRLP